ncbi:MAG: DUF4838 domain-containing protein [Clostridia bacterium]|nr:DUF4838 domain-containing protein [Clostridia bacterium]
MKKKSLLYALLGGAAVLICAAALILFVINPALREKYADTCGTGEVHLFLREGKGHLAADGRFLPVGYYRETTPSREITLSVGETGEMTLWIWACGTSDLEITDVSAQALWSPTDGQRDAAEHIRFGAYEKKIAVGEAGLVRLSFTPDAEMTAGLWRALISVTAKTAAGEERRTYAVDIRLQGETNVVLCRGGSTEWTVVERDEPTAAERAAVDVFVSTVEKVSGCKLNVRKESEPGRGKEIIIGYGSDTAGDDEIAAMSSEYGYIGISLDRITLTGTGDRGTLCAVYTFLEEYCGLRQFTDRISVQSEKRKIVLQAGTQIVVPDFGQRGVLSGEGNTWAFAMPNMLNAGGLKDGTKYGGSITYSGDAQQTLESLIPSNQYYYANRAFYSSRDISSDGLRQLCLSNPEVISRITDKVLATLDGSSLVQRVSLRHIGCDTPCSCANCAAINAQEKSPAGTYIRLVNFVAEKVAENYSGVLLEIELIGAACTPTVTLPAENVLVMLSDAGTTRGENYGENGFISTVRAWRKNTSHLGAVLHIYADGQYLCPVTDAVTLGENIRLLYDAGVEACIFAGCGSVTGAEFGGLKAYVAARVARNADYPAVLAVHDYLYGVFGAAGGYVSDWLDMLSAQLAAKKPTVEAGVSAAVYDSDFLEKGLALLDKAERGCGGDGECLYRLRREKLPLRWAELCLVPAAEWDEFFIAEVERFFADVEHYGITSLTGDRLSAEKAALLAG